MNKHLLLPFILVVASCGKETVTKGGVSATSSTEAPLNPDAAKAAVSVTLLGASSEQCASGGTRIVTFEDLDRDNQLDISETILAESVVCNGVAGSNGQNGIGAGVFITSAPAGACVNGGSVLQTYSDLNNNASLDSNEVVTSLTTICNGVDGQDGSNGQDGVSSYLSVSQANLQQCPAGGVVYSSTQSNSSFVEQVIVCNGVDGQDGTDGEDGISYVMGAVGSEVAGKSYTACYHDYIFFPNENNPDRGWLTFRHQGNGSYNRGIGNTGFQIWNVDIANFSLASEVGNETFCNLKWNANDRELNYIVVTNRDGLAGEQGTIRFD